jgi:hypothetical protein
MLSTKLEVTGLLSALVLAGSTLFSFEVLAEKPRSANLPEFSKTPAEVKKLADAIRPTNQETRWRQIPWLDTALEAQKAAQAEKRPIFVVVEGGDFTDHC